MANLNKVTLIGRLGQDPEIRYTQSGSAVANATIATNDYWTDKQGEKQERTEWHSLVMWGRLADLAQSYLKKGSQVYVEGRIQTRDWEDDQGQKHYKTEVVVTTMQFLDSKISDNSVSTVQPRDRDQQQKSTETHDFEQNDEEAKHSEEFIKDDIPF